MQKRGQVAIFVIIGVIIVIAFAILFFVKQENVGLGRKQLNNYIYDKIDNCIDFSEYEDRGYVINIQEDLTIDITITDDTINLNIKYPFTIERQGVTLSSDGTQYMLALPIGDLFKAVNYILGQESIYGTVDIVNYQITNLNKYKMQIKKPYPDKLYEISLTDYP